MFTKIKRLTATGLIALFLVLALSTASAGFRDTGLIDTADIPLPQLVQQSAVIAYATADTNHLPNITLTITDIWKGTNLAHAINIKRGSHYPLKWDDKGGAMIDGAILFFAGAKGPISPIRQKATYFVRNGRVGSLTTNEFRTQFRLQ